MTSRPIGPPRHTEMLVHLRRARDHADRHYAEPVDLDTLAGIAGLSKYHFLRLFKATYGQTPAAYVGRRRIERSQDLLRATNLTVTEVCFAVGFSSLGSFSSRFRELVGETPSAFQARYAASGAPRIPGCWVFMLGLAERRVPASSTRSAGSASSAGSPGSTRSASSAGSPGSTGPEGSTESTGTASSAIEEKPTGTAAD